MIPAPMMRVSPLGVFGANHDLEQVAKWAKQDAHFTHPNVVCEQANALYVMAIAHTVRTGIRGPELGKQIVVWAGEANVDDRLMEIIRKSAESPPTEFVH